MAQNSAPTANGGRTTKVLDSSPASASTARHFVADTLEGQADPNLIETGVLLVSELVTNAVLHALSEIELSVVVHGDTVRIEVVDHSPVLPARKNYSEEAGTGRGLLLVEAMASAWGSELREGGKVVWFEVVPAVEESSADAEVDLIDVHVLGIPLDIYKTTSQHQDELMREFALILGRAPDERRAVPGQLLELIDELQNRYSGFTTQARTEVQQALDRGDASVDVVYTVPRDMGPAVTHLGDILDAADDYCRSGEDLLTLDSPPEAVAFRNWFLGEFVRQCAGEPPRAWAGT
jgi:anti-sigma regulatory factor (Ser/Thr protein kinase)